LPLDNQCTFVFCKSVTWSLPISLHSAKKYTKVQWPCFNKVKHFYCSVQNAFQAVRHSLDSKSLLVDAAVYPSGVGSNCLHTRYHSTVMAFAPSVQIPAHLDHQSPFDVTKLTSTLKISSPFSRRGCLPLLTPHKCNGYIPGAVPSPPRLLTHPAVKHWSHWLVFKAVIVSKHLLSCHWCIVKSLSVLFFWPFTPALSQPYPQ
jgi:hypothetical protein